MKKFILLALVLLALLTDAVVPQMLWADEGEKVSRLTQEEVTYIYSLDGAYSTALGYVDEMNAEVESWVLSQPTQLEVVGEITKYQQKFSSLSATFRQPPPASMAGLKSLNNAVADNLASAMGPCLAIVGEEAVQQAGQFLPDVVKSFVGISPPKKDGPSVKIRMFSTVTGQLGALKDVLIGGRNALYTRIADIEQERFEKELGAAALEKGLFGECFIATAAYGTPTAEEIDILRQFRDGFLLQNTPGRAFVALYYRLSPPIAEFISEHELVRAVVREGFVDPIVAVVESTQGWWGE